MSNYSSSTNTKISFEAIIAKANAKITVISVKTDDNKVNDKIINNVVGYPRFRPDTTPDIDDKTLVANLLKITKSPVNVKSKPTEVVKPALSLKIPGTNSTWKLTLPNMRHIPDTLMFDRLMSSNLNRFAAKSTTMYRCNGTKKGLLKRLSTKLIPETPNDKIEILNLTMSLKVPIEERFDGSSAIFLKLNPHASAGLPYAFEAKNGQISKVDGITYLPDDYKTTGNILTPLLTTPQPILLHALFWARKMYNDIIVESSSFEEVNKSATRFFANHPELNTFILKRKDERIERDEFHTKIRPYGAQPLPTRLLSMWAVKMLEDNLDNFIENPKSISAYHYSPFYGGCNKILSYFDLKYSLANKFSGLAYGDDQLWQIRLKDGTIMMMAPDVSAMDMSTSNKCIIDIIKFVYSNLDLKSPINIYALYFSLTIAFKHDIHLGGAAILSKLNSLISGIPGTTIINIMNSARIQTVVGKVFEEQIVTEENFYSILSKALIAVKIKLGYEFKGFETLEFDLNQNFDKDVFSKFNMKFKDVIIHTTNKDMQSNGISLPFLSNKIIPFTLGTETRLLSCPYDIEKLGLTLILPDDYDKGSAKVVKSLERIAGAYISGGWIDENFSSFLTSQYKSTVNGLRDITFSLNDVPSIGELDVLELMKYLTRSELPSREFMFDFYTLPKEKFSVKYSDRPEAIYTERQYDGIIVDAQEKSSKDEIQSADSPDFKSLDKITLKNVVKNENLDNDDFNELDKVLVFDKNKIVPVAKIGHYNANTIVKQDLKIKRLEGLKARRNYEMKVLESSVVSAKDRRRLGKIYLDAVHAGDNRDELMNSYYEEVDLVLEDMGVDQSSDYMSLKESNYDFYTNWDGYVDEDIDVVDQNLEDDAYYDSKYGKFELEFGGSS